MSTRQWQAALLGFAGALGVFAVLFYLIGGREILVALTAADPLFVGITFAFGLCWLFAWSLMLRTLLVTMNVYVSVLQAFFVYSGAVFANNITPFGQAGGEPFAALLISRHSTARYETGLVGIASVDVLNVVSSVSLILLGIGSTAIVTTVDDQVQTATVTALALVTGICVVLAVLWRHRHAIAERVARTVAAAAGRIDSGRFDPASLETNIRGRTARFFEHIERLAVNPRRLGIVLGLSLFGWLFQSVALLAAFQAVGYAVPVYVLFFVIPLGNVAGATPLPGGLGGVEAAFIALLAVSTGVPEAAITAAVLIYRGAIYWMPTLIGGTSVGVLRVRAV